MSYNPRNADSTTSVAVGVTTTLASWGTTVRITATANMIVTLPPVASNIGLKIELERIDATAFTVTVQRNGTDTFEDGSASFILPASGGNSTLRAVAAGIIAIIEDPISSASSSASETVTQTAHGFAVLNAIYWTGAAWAKALANVSTTAALGIVTQVIDANNFVVTFSGKVTVAGHGLTLSNYYWLDQTTAGLANTAQPISGLVQELLFVRDANTLQILIGQMFSVALSAATGTVVGDAKCGFQAADHAGWILLNGRLKSTLTATQQTQATALGFGVNIPNVPVGGVLVKGTLGATVGSATITQANLPNVNLSGGNHVHSASDSGHSHTGATTGIQAGGSAGGGSTNSFATTSSPSTGASWNVAVNSSNANITVAASGALSIPLGGVGAAYTPAGVGVNQFVYLGA